MAKRITASDVARAAGVSRSTVSFVLNSTPGQKISESVKERVLEEAVRLGYQPDPHARALASGQSRIVLILLPEWPVESLLRGMLDQAASDLDSAGYSLVTVDPRTSGHAAPLWETLRPDVVIAVDELSEVKRQAINDAGIPLVLPHGPHFEHFDKGSGLQLEHLAAAGHHSLAFASTSVTGMERLNSVRLATIRKLAAELGVELVDATVRADNAALIVASWRAQGVTGVAAFNDDVAALVVGAAVRAGINVPGELAVIGHDDTPLAALIVPSLSSVRFDVAEMGHGFAQQALTAIQSKAFLPISADGVTARIVARESS